MWQTELSEQAVADLSSIFDHLFASHLRFGHDRQKAAALARDRVREISAQRARISTAPFRGTVHLIRGRQLRHVTIKRTIYWFKIDEEKRIVSIEAIFFGGQDHFSRMSARLRSMESGEAD